MVHLVTQHTAVTRQTPAAKSHLLASNTLHLVPVEHLRNLVATHPAAMGVDWSNHVWDPFLPVFLVDTGFTCGKQPVLAERFVRSQVGACLSSKSVDLDRSSSMLHRYIMCRPGQVHSKV
ncbi:TPA: hypothetical protein ACH3X1_013809 [Trebouxia sp. C0004]